MKLLVSLCSGEDDVHPDAHSFRTGSHQVVSPLPRFHAESQFWVWRPDGLQVIHVHLFDSLYKSIIEIYAKILANTNISP